MIKNIDVFFAYLLCSLLGFALVWRFDDDIFVLLPKALLIASGILFIKNLTRLINNPVAQLYILCFVVFLIYYTVFGSSQTNVFVVYKSLFISVFFNFLLGFTLVYHLNKISRGRRDFYIWSAFFGLIFVLLLVSTTDEPYYVVPHRIDLYQTLSDYMLRLVIFCTLLLCLNEKKDSNKNFYFLVFWILALLISLTSGAKKQLFIELPMIMLGLYYLIAARSIRIKLFASVGLTLFFAYTLDWSVLSDSWAPMSIGGMNFEKISLLIERSIVDRIEIIRDNFLHYLDITRYMGNPWVHELVGENYVHSSVLSLFTSFGVFFGLLVVILITCTVLSFRHSELRVIAIVYLVSGVSVMATFFDWMLLWFVLGGVVACYKPHSNLTAVTA